MKPKTGTIARLPEDRAKPIPPLTAADIARFRSKFKEAGETVCWEWTGNRYRVGGYGKFTIGRQDILAHRLSYQVHIGDPGSRCVLHSCDNPQCVNPKHFFLGTSVENTADRHSKERDAISNATLSAKPVIEIRRMYAAGELSQHQIAKLFGVSQSTIWRAVKGKSWEIRPWSDDIDPKTIPDEVIASENGRRNALRRTSYTGGVYWAKHNPDTPRCRCRRCMARREREEKLALIADKANKDAK